MKRFWFHKLKENMYHAHVSILPLVISTLWPKSGDWKNTQKTHANTKRAHCSFGLQRSTCKHPQRGIKLIHKPDDVIIPGPQCITKPDTHSSRFIKQTTASWDFNGNIITSAKLLFQLVGIQPHIYQFSRNGAQVGVHYAPYKNLTSRDVLQSSIIKAPPPKVIFNTD